MNNSPKFMKKIMTKSNIQKSMTKYDCYYREDSLRLTSIKDNFNRVHMCGNTKFGFFDYLCPSCGTLERVPLSCKSRICNKCGKIYAEKWATKLSNDLLNVPHKHLVFSLPKNLRTLIFFNRDILSELCISINEILSAVIHGNTKSIGKKKKLGRPSKKSKKKKAVKLKFGLVTVIHTFGRDGQFNPHFHCLMTKGSFDKEQNFKPLTFLSYTFLRYAWQTAVLKLLAKKFPYDQKVKNLININYNNSKNGFYVNAEQDINKPKGLAKYIGRYLARPAIAEYRILDFSNGNVTYWYEDTKTKSKLTTTVSVEQFIFRVFSHVPHKHFRLVHRFGLYSRRLLEKDKELFSKFSAKLFKSSIPTWVERITVLTGVNPLQCKNCYSTMKKKLLYHFKYGYFEYS